MSTTPEEAGSFREKFEAFSRLVERDTDFPVAWLKSAFGQHLSADENFVSFASGFEQRTGFPAAHLHELRATQPPRKVSE